MLDNRHRIYAIDNWTVERKHHGWFIKRTYSSDAWRDPYHTKMRACLMMARQMCREVIRRDTPPSELPSS